MKEKPNMLDFTPVKFITYIENVFKHGNEKGYEKHGWIKGKDFNFRDNHASINRHVAEGYCGVTSDKDSGLDPYTHAAVRCLMAAYIREAEQNEVTDAFLKKNDVDNFGDID